MRMTGEVVTVGLSAPFMLGGLVAVAVAETWAGQGAGFAAVIGGSIALASGRWRTRVLAWSLAAVGVLAALQVRA